LGENITLKDISTLSNIVSLAEGKLSDKVTDMLVELSSKCSFVLFFILNHRKQNYFFKINLLITNLLLKKYRLNDGESFKRRIAA